MSAPVFVDSFGRTDIGCVRDSNQDSYLIGSLDRAERLGAEHVAHVEVASRGPLFLVCDGMGGAAGGEVAARLAAEVVWAEMCASEATEERPVFARILRRAVRLANRRVFQEAQKNPRLRGMGTTLSAAGLVGDAVVLAQVGDSRAYVHRGSTLTQVTRDQSIVSALLHAGRITEDEARASVRANMILQALGVREDVDVSLSIVEVRRGDLLLLCSDGLHGPVSHEQLQASLVACPDLDEAVNTMIALARNAGGPDNATAVLARFGGEGLRQPFGEDDLPRFVEFNPMEEGPGALTTTSWVARRLAAQAGIGDDPGPPSVPATGQHAVFRGDVPEIDPAAVPEFEGPATARLAQRERLGLIAWVVALAIAAVVVLLLLWDRL